MCEHPSCSLQNSVLQRFTVNIKHFMDIWYALPPAYQGYLQYFRLNSGSKQANPPIQVYRHNVQSHYPCRPLLTIGSSSQILYNEPSMYLRSTYSRVECSLDKILKYRRLFQKPVWNRKMPQSPNLVGHGRFHMVHSKLAVCINSFIQILLVHSNILRMCHVCKISFKLEFWRNEKKKSTCLKTFLVDAWYPR